LVINGRYEGVYLDTERVDKDFLDAHKFFDDDASIYRCGRKDCEMKPWRAAFQTDWEKKTNEREGREELHEILEAITFTPEPDLGAVLGERLELELHLRAMVLDALISMNITEDSRSYFIHDGATGRWTYVPWDLNNSVLRWTPGSAVGGSATANRPLFGYSLTDSWVHEKYVYRTNRYPDVAWHPVSSNLNTRIAMNPVLRARLVVLLERALDEIFAPDVFGARVDAIHALLRSHVADDPYTSIAKFDDTPRYLKEYNVARIAFIRGEIARLMAAPALVISMLDPHQQRVALRNLGTAPVELQGLALVTNSRARPSSPNLPANALSPGESLELEATAIGLQFASRGEVALFDPTQANPFDVLFYGEIPPGTAYARSDVEPQRWEVRSPP
jgi:spore coat protein H